MKELIWLIPTLPLIGAFLLIVFGSRISRSLVPMIGAGSVGLSALITILIGIEFKSSSLSTYHYVLWNWVEAGDFKSDFAFHLDALSLVFIFVITFVGFLIHLYSAEFME